MITIFPKLAMIQNYAEPLPLARLLMSVNFSIYLLECVVGAIYDLAVSNFAVALIPDTHFCCYFLDHFKGFCQIFTCM